MKNDTTLKATWVVNKDSINELYFDYYSKDNNLVGNIIVNEKGELAWHILDAAYEGNIDLSLGYILGGEIVKKLDYTMPDADIERWNNAKKMIQARNIYLNYKESSSIENEFDSSFTR